MSAIKCTLYHNPYSVCSIMVRYTLALSGLAKDDPPALEVEEKCVDIFDEEQLSEDFLKINPYGQASIAIWQMIVASVSNLVTFFSGARFIVEPSKPHL